MAYKTHAQLMMQELWRKAYRDGGLEIKFPSKSDAHRGRMALYNSVHAEKRGQIGDDPLSLELAHAAENIEIVFAPGTDTTLWLRPQTKNPMYAAMGAALGQTIGRVTDLSSQASLDRVLAEAGITLEDARPREEAPTATPAPAPDTDLRPEETPFIPPMRWKKNPFY